MVVRRIHRPFTEFARGVADHFRGARMLLGHGSLFGWAAIPIALTLLLLLGLIVGLDIYIWRLLSEWLGPAEGWWADALHWALAIILYAVVLVVAYLLFSFLRLLIAAPFGDPLSLRTEALWRHAHGRTTEAGVKGSAHGEHFMRSTTRAVGDALRLTVAEYGVYLLCLPFLLIPVVGVVPIWWARSYYAGVNALDCSLSCRGFTWPEKRKVFKANRARLTGLGLGMVLFDLTIVLALFSLPAGIVGGTLSYLQLHGTPSLPSHPDS